MFLSISSLNCRCVLLVRRNYQVSHAVPLSLFTSHTRTGEAGTCGCGFVERATHPPLARATAAASIVSPPPLPPLPSVSLHLQINGARVVDGVPPRASDGGSGGNQDQLPAAGAVAVVHYRYPLVPATVLQVSTTYPEERVGPRNQLDGEHHVVCSR